MQKTGQNTADKSELFENMPVGAALRSMAVPTVISQIIVLIYNMADTFYVGRTGNPDMVAGVSLLLPIFNMTICLAGISGVGGGTLVSRLLGKNDKDEARRVSAFALYLCILIAAVFSCAIGVFMRPILLLLGANEQTYLYARQYALCVIVIGGIPTVLSNVLSMLIRSVGYSKSAGFGIALGGILNILLDPLFMFVILPKGCEVMGAGIATMLSNCVACCYFLIVLAKEHEKIVVTFRLKGGLPTPGHTRSVFTVGIPSAVTTLLFDVDYMVIDKLMVAYGNPALAAVGIVLKIERLPLNVGIGICQGMLPIVAYNYSAGNQKRMDDTIRLARRTGLLIAAAAIALYELFAGALVHIFISHDLTVALATDFLRIRVLATPLMFLSFFTVYLFNAFGMGEKSLLLGVTRWLIFNIPMLFILNRLIGMYGLVWSQATADALNVLFSFYIYHRYRPRGLKKH